ncbi:MAG: lipopolysaccharide assembly protein LapA domain-containing protein [Alphaproteobacteria bacterium]
MIALIRWVFGFIIALFFVFFAAFNRQIVTLHYSPLNDPLELPLFAIVLGFSALAFMVGAATVWLSDGKIRRERRGLRRHVKSLEKELDRTEKSPKTQDNPLFPSLPKN